MREIKFRLWDGQRMIKHDVIVAKYFIELDGTVWENVGSYEHDILTERTDVEIMQFTGLKDQNGVEIYEGDLVKCFGAPSGEDHTKEYVGRVMWEVYGFTICVWYKREWWSPGRMSYVPEKLEVIGNIYEHPNLINATV